VNFLVESRSDTQAKNNQALKYTSYNRHFGSNKFLKLSLLENKYYLFSTIKILNINK
jgi:hypothetical protein